MTSILESLPGEVFLQIMSFLEDFDVVSLQLVSKKLLFACRDDSFWRPRCFDESTYLSALRRRRMLANLSPDSAGAAATEHGSPWTAADKTRLVANWDPAFPGENVTWYEEYIQRHAPIAVNWFELPQPQTIHGSKGRGASPRDTALDVRGVALYRPGGAESGDLLAVSPLEDGSVCLWDVSGSRGRRGAIVAQSSPGLLRGLKGGGTGTAMAHKTDVSVVECVSVDSQHHVAFFSVQNHLIEVDLQRLRIVGEEKFPWSITALSTFHPAVPLSIGSKEGIHMHDGRRRAGHRMSASEDDAIEHGDRDYRNYRGPRDHRNHGGDGGQKPWTSHAGPLSILHLQRPGSSEHMSNDIYAAGRLPSILHYDRRKLPSIQDTIYSGGSLSSLTSLPYPFSALNSDLRRQGLLSAGQVERAKTVGEGRTIVAGGEYKSKGSLEMYGIGRGTVAGAVAGTISGTISGTASDSLEGPTQVDSVFKNRQSSSFAKILSVATHGTRLVFSDGAGQIKWVERDGVTSVRSCLLSDGGGGNGGEDTSTSLFGTASADAGDIARKLVATDAGTHASDLLFWTGERLGSIGFSSQPGWTAEDFVDEAKTEQERAAEEQERAYSSKMRQLLEKQANDVRFVGHLGLGSRGEGDG